MKFMQMHLLVLLSFFGSLFLVYGFGKPRCYEILYKLDGQVMQVVRNTILWQSNATHMYLEGCSNDDPGDLEEFDLEVELANATFLDSRFLDLPPLPESSKLETVILIGAEPRNVWGGCRHLRHLEFSFTTLTNVHPDWLANCTKLHEMRFSNRIEEISAVIRSIPDLHTLSAVVDNFQDIVRVPLFPTDKGREKSIRELYLSYELSSTHLSDDEEAKVSAALALQISHLENLKILSLSDVHWFDMCADDQSLAFKSLEVVKVSNTQTRKLCFKNLRIFPKANYIDLTRNKFEEIQFNELFSAPAPILQVDTGDGGFFTMKTVRNIKLAKDDYYNLIDGTKKGNVTLLGLPKVTINCVCKNGWLVRALREELVSAPTVVCSDGSSPMGIPARQSECDRFTCGGTCTCEQDWSTNLTIADCESANLSVIPADLLDMENLVELNIHDNRISRLPKIWSDRLQFIDLSKNAIWQLESDEITALFTSPSRRLKLAGNPIVCNCDNRVLLTALQQYHKQIEDYKDIKCVGNDTFLEDLDIAEICADRDFQAALTRGGLALAVSLSIATLIIGLLVYYRREIKIFLFARGLCLWYIREEEIDADKIYDVFLSFCHKDTAFITENLLPILDKEYKVCVHYRDWYPGEMIPAQISNSVEVSRRTVIILSKNFLDSIWGLLEFRTAHMTALQERRVRVVVIIIDDVLDGDLEGELKSYLRTNTYVKWGDPWFWDKLRYALPHRPVDIENTVTTTCTVSDQSRLEFSSDGIPMVQSISRGT